MRDYYGFIYLWTNTHPEVDKLKYYIGRHKGTIYDGYEGSGRLFKEQLGKYGDYWTREILEYCQNDDELDKREHKYITEVDAVNNPLYCNERESVPFGGRFNEEVRKRMSKAKKGKTTWNKGIPMSEESKEKLRMSIKESNRVPWNKGKVGYRVDSEETKQKRIESVMATGDVKRAERDKEVLAFITENDDTTTKDLKEHLGKSGRMVIESLWRLMEKGLISKRRDGKLKTTYYNKK